MYSLIALTSSGTLVSLKPPFLSRPGLTLRIQILCGLCPAATQRFVERNLALQLGQAGLHHRLLRAEQRALRIQQIEAAGNAVLVAQSRQLEADRLGVGLGPLGEQLRAQQAQANAEAVRFKLSDLRYQNGIASSLDLLDAQRALFSAQQAVMQTRLAQLQSQVTLYKTLGGGWTEPAQDLNAQSQPRP